MAMAITMRMMARIFFRHGGHTRAIVKSKAPIILIIHYTHKNPHQSHIAQSAMALKIQPPQCPRIASNEGTCLGDLAGDRMHGE